MSDSLIVIRTAQDEDMSLINAYAGMEGMDDIPSADMVFVASNSEAEIVGFIRLLMGANGVYHVNPVVVYPTWRRFGVGRALMYYALDYSGELRLVSRGASLKFYESLGAEPIAWKMIDMAVTENCDGCQMFDECSPAPLRLLKGSEIVF